MAPLALRPCPCPRGKARAAHYVCCVIYACKLSLPAFKVGRPQARPCPVPMCFCEKCKYETEEEKETLTWDTVMLVTTLLVIVIIYTYFVLSLYIYLTEPQGYDRSAGLIVSSICLFILMAFIAAKWIYLLRKRCHVKALVQENPVITAGTSYEP